MTGRKHTNNGLTRGSALILTVVLTSILAIVAVLFLLASRVETLSTSSLIDERDLNLAVDTIISKLSNELVLDTPGVAGQEYYDYPGDRDRWLASIEPYDDGGTYKWGQISDPTGYISRSIPGVKTSWDTREVPVKPLGSTVIKEYPEITLEDNGQLEQLWADADGDGIADSKWIELEDVMGSRGRKVYAAVRVIDNAGLLNVNTAYEFDENSGNILRVDGSRLYQINLSALARSPDTIAGITLKRSGMTYPTDAELEDYERYGAWSLADPCDDYTLFDISDELELRYRFLVSSPAITRIENAWEDTISEKWTYVADRPYDARGNWGLTEWENRVTDPCHAQFDRRHLLTAYSLDRIIAADANGLSNAGMINVNFDPCDLDRITNDYDELDSWRAARNFYVRCAKCLDPNLPVSTRQRMKRKLGQLAVNLVDLRDFDTDVTTLCLGHPDWDADGDFGINDYVYGLEPFPVITRVAIRIDPNDPDFDPNDPNDVQKNSYAVELFNPFDREIPLDHPLYNFWLSVTDFNAVPDPNDPNAAQALLLNQFNLYGPSGPASLQPDDYLVLYNLDFFNMDPTASMEFPELRFSSGYFVSDTNTGPTVDANFVNAHNLNIKKVVGVRYDETSVPATDVRYIYMDRQLMYSDWVRWDPNGEPRFYGRPYNIETAAWWDVVYPQTAREFGDVNDPNAPPTASDIELGVHGYYGYMTDRPAIDIAVPYGPGQNLRTVGDIARIWTVGPTDRIYDPCDADNPTVSELFDPNLLDVGPIDPNDPNDVNDLSNTRFFRFIEYSRTVGEKLLFASRARELGIVQDEDFIRLNLADPLYANLFQYITVFDPRVDGIDNDGDGTPDGTNELKVPGRININTAPYFVIEQLPWMTADIAKAIVDYRDMRGKYSNRRNALESELSGQLGYQIWRNYLRDDYPEDCGFASIGELNLIADEGEPTSMWKYALEPGPLNSSFPDLTDAYGSDDRADNDFEERDLIFARISNLATVRSDVFTAYILVRLGTDGPQKRVAAILDRSDVYRGADKVKAIAVHDVSYPK